MRDHKEGLPRWTIREIVVCSQSHDLRLLDNVSPYAVPKLQNWLCKNSTRYNRTRNFERYGHAESKKMQKFVFRSALRPNQISFSHSQDPLPTKAEPNSRSAASP
jgi:hypothetical protein